jgi:hypothetical protein
VVIKVVRIKPKQVHLLKLNKKKMSSSNEFALLQYTNSEEIQIPLPIKK